MDTWQMKLSVTVEADETENLILLLREVIRKIKQSKAVGGDNYYAGVYSFCITDDEGKPFGSKEEEELQEISF